ncbi:VOC family protein [Nonomuraea sp. M3C6]|uniref:VOC family protein n=1 Tax=Nonomuraea marmarensis TaxID=3351344 RepID=A0ABW7AC56_9ACTN
MSSGGSYTLNSQPSDVSRKASQSSVSACMFDAAPGWPHTPAFLRLYVPDADATHRRAVEAGGTSVTEVTHLYFGDRVGRVRDPFGKLWWIQTRIEDVSPEEMERRLSDPEFTKAMQYVQSAGFFPEP